MDGCTLIVEQFHPVGTEEEREALIASFAANAAIYSGYPALLGWYVSPTRLLH
jgi:hypothetical protein